MPNVDRSAPSDDARLMARAIRIVIRGQVQGLGIRPAIYRLAQQHRIAGAVQNTGLGVEVMVEGDSGALARFQDSLISQLPGSASVDAICIEPTDPSGVVQFEIREPERGGILAVPIPTDRAICNACLREVFDPTNRRHRYPWTSCTDCGPRYSIIRAMPYERRRTSVAQFPMCDACRREYEDPADRRFHAQTIACPNCGPQFWSVDQTSRRGKSNDEAINVAVNALLSGLIVAVRGIGGYQLLVDATNETAVRRLRERKRRRAKPFAVLVGSLQQVDSIASLDSVSQESLTSPANPIVLLPSKAASPIADAVHSGLNTIGLMLPTGALHALLIRGVGRPLVCTSGNVEGDPMEYEIESAERRLSTICDVWLHHNLPIENPIDDSVVRTIGERSTTFRMARGFAPLTTKDQINAPMLALGGQQKSSLAWSTGGQTVLGPHLGDLHTIRSRQRYQSSRDAVQRTYRFQPEQIVHDDHPDYYSTAVAVESDVSTVAIQHHQAHVVAVMAEHGWLDEKVLGVAWDGTGFGLDGTIWGGEFLWCSATEFKRFASLRPFRLPGGEVAIAQPWRIAVSIFQQCREFLNQGTIEAFEQRLIDDPLIGFEKLVAVKTLCEKVYSPLTTSAGRLFDAVAAMLLGHHFSDFDGQAAMRLEDIALPIANQSTLESSVETWRTCYVDGQFDWRRPMVNLIEASLAGECSATLAHWFHRVLAEVIISVCEQFPHHKVVLSGGVFQNKLLTEILAKRISNDRLGRAGRIPPNDGGLAYGQLIAAASRYAEVSRTQLNSDRGE